MLSRRALIAAAASAALAPASLFTGVQGLKHFGYIPSGPALEWYNERHGVFATQSAPVQGTSEGKLHSLIQNYIKQTGVPFKAKHQGGVGTCGGVATAWAVEFVTTEQAARGNGMWKGEYSSEVIYAGARVEVAGGFMDRAKIIVPPFAIIDKAGLRDGCQAAWAMEWLQNWGVLLRGKYGKYDLTQYDGLLAREWGRAKNGVPDELEKLAKEHPVQKCTQVRSFEEVCDAIYNGYPVVSFGEQGFRSDGQRDKYGFMDASEHWAHVLQFTGFDRRKGKRQGCETLNQWGNWSNGPAHEIGAPEGSFWVDREIVDRMCKFECFALSSFKGYPRQKPVYKLG